MAVMPPAVKPDPSFEARPNGVLKLGRIWVCGRKNEEMSTL
jgi:hypothetical protein